MNAFYFGSDSVNVSLSNSTKTRSVWMWLQRQKQPGFYQQHLKSMLFSALAVYPCLDVISLQMDESILCSAPWSSFSLPEVSSRQLLSLWGNTKVNTHVTFTPPHRMDVCDNTCELHSRVHWVYCKHTCIQRMSHFSTDLLLSMLLLFFSASSWWKWSWDDDKDELWNIIWNQAVYFNHPLWNVERRLRKLDAAGLLLLISVCETTNMMWRSVRSSMCFVVALSDENVLLVVHSWWFMYPSFVFCFCLNYSQVNWFKPFGSTMNDSGLLLDTYANKYFVFPICERRTETRQTWAGQNRTVIMWS